MSFSETTQIREDKPVLRKFSGTSSGDEAFEKLELKRRLTIVPPGTFLGDGQGEDEENLDIAYDDELIYDDEDNDVDRDEYYERYSDEDLEEHSELIDDHLVDQEEEDDDELPTPQTFEELNALYKPRFEEKLTTIESRFKAPQVEMLSPQQSNIQATPKRSSPQPASVNVVTQASAPGLSTSKAIPDKSPSPLVTRKSSPIPAEIKLSSPAVVVAPSKSNAPAIVDDEYDDDEYSDELYEGEEEETEGSDVDDDDLMRRLEAKYGKLPEHLLAENVDEGQYVVGESDLEDEDDEDDPSWTSKVK